MYSFKQIQEISQDYTSDYYIIMSGLLARIEHFSLGVNTNIYDAELVQRAATRYFIVIYNKLKPMIEKKQIRSNGIKYYKEFETLVESVKKIEKVEKNDSWIYPVIEKFL